MAELPSKRAMAEMMKEDTVKPRQSLEHPPFSPSGDGAKASLPAFLNEPSSLRFAFPPVLPSTRKPSLAVRLLSGLTSRKVKNDIKAFAWILYDKTNDKFQPRTLLNIILAVIVTTPSQTVGKFTDGAIIMAVGLGLAGVSWTLVNTVAGYNYAGMGAISFVCVYLFSIVRAISFRFFGLGLIGPLLTYTAIASAVGVSGANTANGDAFDQAFLRDTMYAFLLGFAASLVINVFLWPEYAERFLIQEMGGTLDTMQVLITGLVKSFSKDSDPSDGKARSDLIVQLEGHIKSLWATLEDVKSEPRVSRFTIQDYEKIIVCISSLATQLSSIEKAIEGNESSLFQHPKFRERLSVPFARHLKCIEVGCANMLKSIRITIEGKKRKVGDDEAGREDGSVVFQNVVDAIRDMEMAQLDVLFEMLQSGSQPVLGKEEDETKVSPHEGLLQVNFFIFGFRKVAQDLNQCLLDLTGTTRRLALRFSLSRYIPAASRPRSSPLSDDAFRLRSAGTGVRRFLSNVTTFLLRKESIYGLKCACAVLLYELVLFNQTSWYRTWYLQASFLTFLVAVGPSVGQTNLTFVINLLGAVLGYSFAYLALTAFGTGPNRFNKVCYGWWGCRDDFLPQHGLWISAVIFSIPMIHIQLNSKLSVLGLLSLLSFSTSILGSWGNRNNPFYDNPWHRYYKLLASAAMAISFALIFTLVVYPNLARERLRLSVSSILRRLNALYTQVLATAYAPTDVHSPASAPVATMHEIHALHLELYRALLGLDELMLFSAVEFRISGPFRWQTYRGIVGRMKAVHERLGSAMSIVGDRPFDPYVRKLLSDSLRKSKRDLQTVIR
ncbi:hypothetical protein HDU67_008071 [Dinochytrium kinnereticum]|nr:hypothetical protein HDU67_008071 [Dinochytrium kinnereticum]